MQSVYKYHLAVEVLHQVDQNKLSLSDSITITQEHLDNGLWSVIRQQHPDGVTLPLSEVVKYTVANSDNVGCDILFDLVGGPPAVENFMRQMGINDVTIKHNEETMQNHPFCFFLVPQNNVLEYDLHQALLKQKNWLFLRLEKEKWIFFGKGHEKLVAL